ncbi:MAG: hypothetical protein ACTSYA_09885 [Candidatus Kariarchaeaceae archaeon]
MNQPTQDEIVSAIRDHYYNDLAFIEVLNNLTYYRKVQLKQEMNDKYLTNFNLKNDSNK